MRSQRQPLEVRDRLPWVKVGLNTRAGWLRREWLILDTGSTNTILSVELAESLGFPESEKTGDSTFDTPDDSVEGYTVRLPAVILAGREIRNYLVGCKVFNSRLHVPGVIGFDFFRGTDLLVSDRRKSIHLAW